MYKKISVVVTEQQHKKVEAAVKQGGFETVSDFIRHLIEQYPDSEIDRKLSEILAALSSEQSHY